MTIDNLPMNEDGLICFEKGARLDGESVSFCTTKDYIERAFPIVTQKSAPLSEKDYEALLSESTPMWKEAWTWARTEGLI